ncbi:MAG: cobalt-precorrin-5B (C(1))-methyltransferase CbiD [Thermodesulfobacteriota bacterium]
MKGKARLRRGFTTGTSAAAGAKAAALALFGLPPFKDRASGKVSVRLPGGGELKIDVKDVSSTGGAASATVIKDGGDDPDVTNKAEIITTVELLGDSSKTPRILIDGGVGVGRVTRPGLKVPVGEPAINPVPLEMIRTAVAEAAALAGLVPEVSVIVSVPQGEVIARKTMNARLGILGGISILGTSGIVEPMSTDAYKDSISCAVDVAVASGCGEVVFSTGRSSEKVAAEGLGLLPQAFITTGDHMGFAMRCAGRKKEIKKIIVAGQFGKFTKLAAGCGDTHCSRSSVDMDFIADTAAKEGITDDIISKMRVANTAREIFFILKDMGNVSVIRAITKMVRDNSAKMSGGDKAVKAVLVGYEADVVCVVSE